jgi:glycyl-tRNA synthetase
MSADNLIDTYSKGEVNPDAITNDEMEAYINEHHVNCPVCGNFNWTPIRQFHLMFQTSRDITGGADDVIYLRPETAQGEFVNFMNVQRTTRAKVPFGIGQIGKAFRNEITPGNFTFRTIEFEQMEHQLFCKNEESGFDFYSKYKKDAYDFLIELGFNKENLNYKDHEKLAHYAKAACDIIFKYPFGWNELNGIHYRTDYDLSRHQEYSGKNMLYIDPVTNEKYVPHVVEYSIGADRLTLAVLCEFYDEETLEGGDTRIVYRFHPAIAPYKVAVLPLQKNLSEKAREIYKKLSKHFMCTYDEAGSIGKRYRRQDQIGTPYCVTIDFETMENETVTIRDRDTMEQRRISIDELIAYVNEKILF